VAAVCLVGGPVAAVAAEGELELTRLTDRLSLIAGAGANVVVLETADGLALVDSGSEKMADALLDLIAAEFDGAPIRVLFNTNWRPDHTGANEAIAQRGATIIAHENTRLWMGTEYYVEWEQKNYPPRPAAALPTRTFYSSDPQPLYHELGGYRIEYGHLAEAHTDGDIYVRFVDDDVIAVGDVLAVDAFPMLDYSTGGWIGGAEDAMARLLELAGAETGIIAGECGPQTRGALVAQQALLAELKDRIGSRMIQGKSIDEIFEDNVTAGYESFPDPKRFVSNVYNGLWWGGRLRGPI
jgi:glyoxylase-like metal-dependent hydrolase (beta-lactamase superfamily II)